MDVAIIQDRYAVGGVDLAETTDLCCASALVPLGGKLHLFQKYFVAEPELSKTLKLTKWPMNPSAEPMPKTR